MMSPAALCAHCGKPVTAEHAPFCSRGCRDRDLLKWLGEEHRIPGRPATADGLDMDEDAD
jgi:endogenous inhibitor of DNA gyrase (YacG/DUF329 family)